MNQIICTSNSRIDILNSKKNYKKNFLKIQFLILVFIAVITIIYYVHFRYDLYHKEMVSKSIKDNFGLSNIYSMSSDYEAKLLSEDILFYESSSFSVIGIIEINKLNISYPILSDINKDLLKLSPCRFYGPMPNETR